MTEDRRQKKMGTGPKMRLHKRGLSPFFVSCLTAVFLTLTVTVSPALSGFLDEKLPEGEWRRRKDTHFIVYYHPSIPRKYIRDFTRKCEGYYDVLTERLGFNRFDFWLWEDRAKIFVYKTREEYIEGTGRPQWSGASVNIKLKRINTFYFDEDFFDVLLPHELTHIVLREFIGMDTKVPLWFDEGVACMNEKESYTKYLLVAKGFAGKKLYIPVPKLENLTSERNVIFASVFYSTAASLLMYLIEEYKKDNFTRFLKELRDGRDFYKAMDHVYGIRDAGELDKRFLKFLKRKSYRNIVENKDFVIE